MIIVKSREEIELMRESALIVSKTLGMIASEIKEGVTTLYLDKLAETFIRDHGAEPSFLGLYGFPNSLCMSPNSQVVHGIPNNTPLKSGDVISVDCGAYKNGYHGDHAYSFEIGEVAFGFFVILSLCSGSCFGNSLFFGDYLRKIRKFDERNFDLSINARFILRLRLRLRLRTIHTKAADNNKKDAHGNPSDGCECNAYTWKNQADQHHSENSEDLSFIRHGVP